MTAPQPTAITVRLLDQNTLAIHFRYDLWIAAAMRTVHSATWTPKLHAWTVPRSQANTLEAALSPWAPYVIWYLTAPTNPHRDYAAWATQDGPRPTYIAPGNQKNGQAA